MKEVYHYTKLKYLQDIIKPDGCIWLARYYKYFSLKDYEWIRNEAHPIIEEICKERKWWYDPNFPMYKPYIISFCKSIDSQYMWKYFGDNGKGINIVVDEIVLEENATLQSKTPALLIPCEYINPKWTKNKLKEKILKIAESKTVAELQDDDRLLYSAIGILNNSYWKQKEIRYVTIENRVSSINWENSNVKVVPFVLPRNEWGKFIPFPKELIKGIILGRETTEEQFKDVTNYLIKSGYKIKRSSRNNLYYVSIKA